MLRAWPATRMPFQWPHVLNLGRESQTLDTDLVVSPSPCPRKANIPNPPHPLKDGPTSLTLFGNFVVSTLSELPQRQFFRLLLIHSLSPCPHQLSQAFTGASFLRCPSSVGREGTPRSWFANYCIEKQDYQVRGWGMAAQRNHLAI